MVATSGTGWVLAPCLERLIDETDRLFPKRSTASDGSVGDQAHSARASDHNPSGGYVRAVDVTDDDEHGCNVGLLAAHLVASKDRRVKYLIHKGTIWKARTGFAPEVYTGSNAHLHHLHISIADGQENALGAWWPQSKPKPTEDDMTPAQAEMLKRVATVVERLHDATGLDGLDDAHGNILGRVNALYLDMKLGAAGEDVDLDELVAAIQALPAKTVAALKAAL